MVLGEDDPAVVADFMGFPYETAKEFFRSFLTHYLETEEEEKLREVTEKASLLAWSRMIHQIYKKRSLSDEDRKRIDRYARRIAGLAERLDTLTF